MARGWSTLIVPALILAACNDEVTPNPTPTDPGATPTAEATPTATAVPPGAPGAVEVVVTDPTSRPLSGVSVVVGGAPLTTSADGRVSLGDLSSGQDVLVEISAEGRFPTSKRVGIVPGATSSLRVALQDAPQEVSFSVAEGYLLEDFTTGLRISLPPNALVTDTGSGYGGAAILDVSILDLDADALSGIPGMLLATDPSGPPKPLAAYAALSFSARTSAGATLVLASGKAVTVELPLPDADILGEGATVPLWIHDTTDGRYRAAASGVVRADTLLADRRAVQGQLTSLGTWVAARPGSGAWAGGTVRARGGAVLPGAAARVMGGYPAVYSETWAGTDGSFCTRVSGGSAVTVEGLVDEGGVVFAKTAQVTPAAECAAGAGAVEIGLDAGCIGGTVQSRGGGPAVGTVLWTDAATLDVSDEAGGFCVSGPSDRAVIVRSDGFNDRSTRPTVGGVCQEGGAACSAQLTLIPPEVGWTYRMSQLELAAPGVGLDVTGDGVPDNGLADALQAGYSGILTQIDRLLDELVERGILTQVEADAYYQAAVDKLDDVDASLALEPMQQAVSRGSLLWILDVIADDPTSSMEVWEGVYTGIGFDRGMQIADFDGTAAGSAISVGPQDLSFTLPPPGFPLPVASSATIRILGARATGNAGPTELTGGLLGGVVPTSDLVIAANLLIPEEISPEGAENGIALPKEEILDAIEAWLAENADVALPGGGTGLSATLAFEGRSFAEAPCAPGYWMNDVGFAPDDVGFDLDGDGTIDNGGQELLLVLAAVFEESLRLGLIEEGIPPLVAEQAAETAGDLIAASLAVDNVNAKIEGALVNLRAVPLLTLAGSNPSTLSLWSGDFRGDGYAPGASMWQMEGATVAGHLEVSEDLLVRTFAPDTPVSGDGVSYSITLRLPRARADVLSTGLTRGVIGYAVTIDQILVLVRAVIDNLQTLPALEPGFGDALYEQLEAELTSGADLDLGTFGKAYSLMFEFEAPAACLISQASPAP